MAEENIWERLGNLKNVIKMLEEFEKGKFDEKIWRILARSMRFCRLL